MKDRDLLVLAAKAAGIRVIRSRLSDPMFRDFLVDIPCPRENSIYSKWNPLTDDGDSLRLAVKLRLDLMFDVVPCSALAQCLSDDHNGVSVIEVNPAGAGAAGAGVATRRAIVLAAAELAIKNGRDTTLPALNYNLKGDANA